MCRCTTPRWAWTPCRSSPAPRLHPTSVQVRLLLGEFRQGRATRSIAYGDFGSLPMRLDGRQPYKRSRQHRSCKGSLLKQALERGQQVQLLTMQAGTHRNACGDHVTGHRMVGRCGQCSGISEHSTAPADIMRGCLTGHHAKVPTQDPSHAARPITWPSPMRMHSDCN